MARVFVISTTFVLALVATSVADAQPRNAKATTQTRTNEAGDVVFTVVSAPGQTHLTAEAPTVTFEKISSESGIAVRISVPGDAIEFRSDAAGQVAFARNGKSKRLKARALGRDDGDDVQSLLLRSKAMRAFDGMAGALEDSDRVESTSVLATHALMKALSGDPAAARTFARRLKARTEGGMRLVAQRQRGDFEGPSGCWQEYQQTVTRYAFEMDRCYRDNLWNPFGQAACSVEWLIKVELAWAWVIACHGGFPVP
jgi:hypothetical protein